MIHPTCRLLVPVVALAAVCALAARPQSGGPQAADPAALIAAAQQAADKHDGAALGKLMADGQPAAWLAASRSTPWKAYLMQAPGSSAQLAVFSGFHTCESIGDRFYELFKSADGWRLGAEVTERNTLGYRVRDHKADVHYELPKAGCKITDEVEIERVGSAGASGRMPPGTWAAGEICLLRLSADMLIDSVTIGGKPAREAHVPGLIALRLPAGRFHTVRLAYHGTVSHTESDYIRTSEAVLVSYWYPHIGRLPAKLQVSSTVPKGWTAVGQGELLKREELGAETRFTFRNTVPTCYFSLDAGPYQITSREVDGRKLSVYELRKIGGRAERSLSQLAACLAWYEKSWGKYPYTHYELVETLGPFGGALEAYSFSTYDRGAFGAVQHEVAHTWWGGIVPCTYTKSMWNESFASYSDPLFSRVGAASATRDGVRPKALRGQHIGSDKGRSMQRVYATPVGEAKDTSNGGDNASGYGKGALVLDMLEDLLGTDQMIRCMRRFNEEHRPGEEANWSDFERAVNGVTGKDWRWFFSQWIERGGVPSLVLANVKRAESASGWTVSGDVVQDGKPYRLKLPVVVDLEGGGTQAGEIDVDGERGSFTLSVRGKPTALHLDPAGNILLAGAPNIDDPFNTRLE